MTLIHVPRPKQSAMNPDRPASSLLLAQVAHLREAETNLPLRYHGDVYIHAIRTEGEAAAYIRQVTEAIHQAHEDAAAQRAKPTAREKKIPRIAAAAARASQKRSRKTAAKSGKRKGV